MLKDKLIEALAGKQAKGQKLRTGQRVRLLRDIWTYKMGDEVVILYSYRQHYKYGAANAYAVTGEHGFLAWLDLKDLSIKFLK